MVGVIFNRLSKRFRASIIVLRSHVRMFYRLTVPPTLAHTGLLAVSLVCAHYTFIERIIVFGFEFYGFRFES